MNRSRRQMLQWALGAGQVALLHKFGLLEGTAQAQTMDVPTRLAVLYVPGGWRPQYGFFPLADTDVDQVVPAPGDYLGEPVFFRAPNLVNLAPANGPYAPLRTWQSWNPANPGERANGFSPAMYGYTHWQLHEQLSVLHGIDQGTNDHQSGFISSMCGVAGADFRAPSVHSVIANHLFNRFKETRPLPNVIVTSERGTPIAMGMPSHAAPVRVPSIAALSPQLSSKPADNRWWTGLDGRTAKAELDVRGTATGGTLKTTALEEFTLSQPGRYLGRSTAKVDNFLEGLHGSLKSVSRVLATDVVNVLQTTKGIDALTATPAPYLSSYQTGAFGYTFGLANFHMTQLEARMDLGLRLLKADLSSAVHISLALDFDTHNGTGHAFSCAHGRNIMDCVARFCGELKSTPLGGGKTLLDDTLVLVMSEFGRTWASASGSGFDLSDNHHPFTSVMYLGGNVAANRQVGNYTRGGLGVPVNIIEENGQPAQRVPRSADAVTTALKIMGLDTSQFFIPGGYGEVVGLRKT